MRALEALADELAHARAEARQHCAAAERARSAAQRLGQARTVALGTVALGTVGTVAPGVCMHTLLPRACTCCMKEGRKDLWTRTQRVDGATVYGHTTPKRPTPSYLRDYHNDDTQTTITR